MIPNHENLSATESAEPIAAHISQISKTYPPLNLELLPPNVREKLRSPGCAPKLSEYDVYNKIKKAKKPRSGTKYDLPRDIINEFGPEIATPLTQIINTIFSSGE